MTKTWKNKNWEAKVGTVENGVKIEIFKMGIKKPVHKEIVPFGQRDSMSEEAIPKYVAREVLQLMIETEKEI